jgi:hypothetical protein
VAAFNPACFDTLGRAFFAMRLGMGGRYGIVPVKRARD